MGNYDDLPIVGWVGNHSDLPVTSVHVQSVFFTEHREPPAYAEWWFTRLAPGQVVECRTDDVQLHVDPDVRTADRVFSVFFIDAAGQRWNRERDGSLVDVSAMRRRDERLGAVGSALWDSWLGRLLVKPVAKLLGYAAVALGLIFLMVIILPAVTIMDLVQRWNRKRKGIELRLDQVGNTQDAAAPRPLPERR